jgi:hypothetical protein
MLRHSQMKTAVIHTCGRKITAKAIATDSTCGASVRRGRPGASACVTADA